MPTPTVLILLIGEVLEDPRVLKTCQSLAAEGAVVTVACTNQSKRPERERYEGIDIRRFRSRREYWLKRTAVRLQGMRHAGAGAAISRAHEEKPSSPVMAALRTTALKLNARHYLADSRRIERLMVDAFRGSRFDLVHANDVDTLRAGSELKRIGAARELLYDSHEYWPGIAGWRNVGLIREEMRYIRDADHVVTVNDMIAEMIQRDHALAETPASVMNCPRRGDGDVHPERLHDPVRVIYQGKLQAYRGLPELVLAFREVEGAVLTFSGYGPLEEPLKQLVRAEGLTERVRFLGRYGPGETLGILAEHDIGVMPFPALTESITYCAPNKLFDYAMAGLAICATDLPFLALTVNDHGMGALMHGSDSSEIARAITAMTIDMEALVRYRKNSRAAALDTFSWEAQWRNYPWHPSQAGNQ